MAASILSDWLALLEVPYTQPYSDRRFSTMPFHSLFGLSKLLEEYGVSSEGLLIADKPEISQLEPPFVAQMRDGSMAIVTRVAPGVVEYTTQGVFESVDRVDFLNAWTGVCLLAYPQKGAAEPGLRSHRMAALVARLRDTGLWACLAAVIVYMFVAHGLDGRWSTVLIALLDCVGLAFSFMLVQKTVGVRTRISDHVCGVLQEGGCDDILATKASTFLGIFHWSEVGLSYFGISLLTLLLFPDRLPDLAMINVLCLPYTLWSIYYQHFVAHRWCTMCVGVQATLWLLFFCYLGGGCFRGAWPPHIEFFALGATYIVALLALNKYSRLLKYITYDDTDDENDTPSRQS